MPLEEARIPVLDRGFIFGDGVYEVIPAYSGYPFRMEQHLKRLQSSLDAIKLVNPMTSAQWGRLVRTSRNGRVQIYELDFGRGHKVVTHVFWADPDGDARPR